MTDELDKLLSYQERLTQLDEQIEVLADEQETIIDTMSKIIQGFLNLSDDEKQVLAGGLYWNANLSEKLLAILLGCKPQQVSYRLPTYLPRPCLQCGTLQQTKVYKNGNYYGFLCNNCKQANRLERRKSQTEQHFAVPEETVQTSPSKQELKAMPYSEYLQTDHWKTLRKAMFRRAGFRCQLCNAQGELHVHHKTYERKGAELYSDLIVLCKNCHAKFHNKD